MAVKAASSVLSPRLRGLAPGAARATTLAMAFAFNIAIARTLGPADSGHFFTAIVAISLLSMLGRNGLDLYVLKHASSLHKQGVLDRASLDWRWLVTLCLVLSGAAGAVAVAAASLLSRGGAPRLAEAIVLLALVVPFQSISILNSALLRSVGRAGRGAFAELGLSQGLALVGTILIAMRGPVSLAEVCVVFLLATVATTAWSLWEVRRSWPTPSMEREERSPAPPLGRRRALGEMTNMMASSVLFYGLTWLPVLALGVGSEPAQTAFFMAAVRYPNMISIIPTIQMTAVVPELASNYRTGRLREVNARLQVVNRQAAAIAVPVGVLAVLLSDPLIALFGQEFAPAVPALRVLLIGQVLVVLVGFVNPVMLFADLERSAVVLAAGALLIGAPASVLAARLGGATGVALAYAAITLAYACAAALVIYRRRQVVTFLGPARSSIAPPE